MEICICNFCQKTLPNDNSKRNHERLCKLNPNRQISSWVKFNHERGGWNKGLTADSDERVRKTRETYKQHLAEGKIKPSQLGKPLTAAHKASISNGMKKAHANKIAHNIGESRWNTEHSWPEKWFIRVLSNEFQMEENEHYKTEMPFGKYALDFAWPDKKLCIEIDGEQHERFEDYKQRDIEKDKLLLENGWQVIRIKWKDCFKNPKEYINLVRNKFIELQLF